METYLNQTDLKLEARQILGEVAIGFTHSIADLYARANALHQAATREHTSLTRDTLGLVNEVAIIFNNQPIDY
jgi:hypothetical protein